MERKTNLNSATEKVSFETRRSPFRASVSPGGFRKNLFLETAKYFRPPFAFFAPLLALACSFPLFLPLRPLLKVNDQ